MKQRDTWQLDECTLVFDLGDTRCATISPWPARNYMDALRSAHLYSYNAAWKCCSALYLDRHLYILYDDHREVIIQIKFWTIIYRSSRINRQICFLSILYMKNCIEVLWNFSEEICASENVYSVERTKLELILQCAFCPSHLARRERGSILQLGRRTRETRRPPVPEWLARYRTRSKYIYQSQ